MTARRTILWAILLFWGIMTGWFVLREVVPGAFSRLSAGYQGMMPEGVLVVDKWMKISVGDQQIGYSHTGIETDEEDAVHRYQIVNETELDITLMGQRRQVSVTAEASLDALYHLQRFLFLMNSGPYAMRVIGVRTEEEQFDVHIRTGDTTRRMTVEIPDDAIIYSPMMTLQLKQLKPGQQLRVKTFDPLSFRTTDVQIEALRTELLRHAGVEKQTTVLAVNAQGVEVLSWVDADGEILRQETPFGWVLEACDAREAMAFGAGSGEAQDLLVDLAVPVAGTIRKSHRKEGLRIRLHGAEMEKEDLHSRRQEVHALLPLGAELTLKPDRLPDASPRIDELHGDFAAQLESTPYVQADDPAIVQRARRILDGEQNSLRAALRIYEWVHANVRKEPTVSVPSAAAVLQVMEGDCNEHTYLFVALARAVGLPATISVGLAYNEGAFYYHAWPAVYVGRWLEMDPTLGQPAVEATHIKLLEGELEDQMKLMHFIGRLRLEVLDD